MENFDVRPARFGRSAMLSLFVLSLPVFASEHLPFSEGNSWRLELKGQPQYWIELKMSQVAASTAGTRTARLDWISPWGNYGMAVRSSGAGVYYEGIYDDKNVVQKFPAPAALFAAGRLGESWQSSVGKVFLAQNGLNVTANNKKYSNVAHYWVQYDSGSSQSWYLAPGVGFVQFGDGDGAFYLTTSRVSPEVAVAPGKSGACPLLGMDANPVSTSTFSTSEMDLATSYAKSNGSRYADATATWEELEPSSGKYNLTSLVNAVTRARAQGLTVSVTLKPIDGPNRAIPSDLKALAWDDARLILRWNALLGNLATALRSHSQYVHLSNEVDSYFLGRQGELSAYERFLFLSRQRLTNVWPGASVGVVFSYDTLRRDDTIFRRLQWFGDHVAFTYYGFEGEAYRDTRYVEGDIAQMQTLSSGRKVLLTELGYPSGLVSSGTADQKRYYEATGRALERASGNIIGARFFQMHDMPAWVVDQFTTVYGFPAESMFVKYLGSLGLHDQSGRPKEAWSVFQQTALKFNSGTNCSQN